ncbi:unnamed protein product [Prunus brigantina]
MVLSSAAKKWKDFKSTLTRQFILPFTNEKEKLKDPPQLYNFIEKSEWDAFVASRLSPDFEKGEMRYDLKKQVSKGTLTVSGCNDVLTLALGTPEHGGRVRGVGAGVSPTQFFNLPRQQRVTLADKLKESDLSKLDMPTPLLALCQYVETKLKPANETITVHMPEEMFGTDHDTWLLSEDILQFASMVEIGTTVIAVYMRYLFDYLKMANMVKLVGLVDPGQVSSESGMLSYCSKHLSESLKKADGDQFYLVPYNPGGRWVLIIVRTAKETVYYMNSLPNRSVDEDMRNIVNTSIKMYNFDTGKQSSRKSPIWKNLQGTPRQPTNVECGYYVMRFMRDIIHDPALVFEKKFDKKKKEPVVYTQEHIDEVRLEWAEFVNKQLQNNN